MSGAGDWPGGVLQEILRMRFEALLERCERGELSQ